MLEIGQVNIKIPSLDPDSGAPEILTLTGLWDRHTSAPDSEMGHVTLYAPRRSVPGRRYRLIASSIVIKTLLSFFKQIFSQLIFAYHKYSDNFNEKSLYSNENVPKLPFLGLGSESFWEE